MNIKGEIIMETFSLKDKKKKVKIDKSVAVWH